MAYTVTERSLSKSEITRLANDELLEKLEDLYARCVWAAQGAAAECRRQMDALMVEARKRKLVNWGEFEKGRGR